MSTSSDHRNPVEALAEEFLDRRRRGEPVTPEAYAERHPDLAGEILSLFPALLLMEDIGGDSAEKTGTTAWGSRTTPGAVAGRLGEFRLLREVGRGGMGVVYEAEQESLGRRVALKVLPAGALTDANQVRRFEREARSAARLHHTNIVPVFGVGQHEGTHYYVMQFIQGQGLDAVLEELKSLRQSRGAKPAPTRLPGHTDRRRVAADIAQSLVTGRLGSPTDAAAAPTGAWSPAPTVVGPAHSGVGPPSGVSSSGGSGFTETDRRFAEGVAKVGVQVAEALAYAHGQGILHRDIKPSNLLLDRDAHVWVADFGLAKTTGGEDLTHTGDVVGTVRYMAPERFRGEGDARADVYALGLTLYEMLAFRPAFDGTDRATLIRQVTQEDPPRLRRLNRRVPTDLETIIHKAMAREPNQRYATAAALADDLHRFLDGEPIVARPIPFWERAWKWAKRRPAAAALIVVVNLAAVALLTMGVVSYIKIGNALERANDEKAKALAARAKESVARQKADEARNAALAETYRASLSEVRALRAGHPPGWRGDALRSLARLAAMPTPRRDPTELRVEAVASLGELDIELEAKFDPGDHRCWEAAFSPDGRLLAALDGTANLIRLWDVRHRRYAGELAAGDDLAGFAFRPDGSCLAYHAPGNKVVFHPLGAGAVPPPLEGAGEPRSLAFDASGRLLAVAWTTDYQVRRVAVHDLAAGAVVGEFAGPFEGMSFKAAMAISPDGRLVATVGPDHAVRVHEVGGPGPDRGLGRHRDRVSALAFSPDGAYLASASNTDDRTVKVWDVAAGREHLTLHGHSERVWDVAFSPDGSLLASVGDDATVRLWDARDGRELLAAAPGMGGTLLGVAFDPTGRKLAVGGRSVGLLRIEGREEVRPLRGHGDGVARIAFASRAGAMASLAHDQVLIAWDLDAGRPRLRRQGPGGRFFSDVAIRPDGRLVAAAIRPRGDRAERTAATILLWDLESDTARTLSGGHRVVDIDSQIEAMAFDPTGRRLATGDARGDLVVWDIESGIPSRRESFDAPIQDLAWASPDRLVVGRPGQVATLIDPVDGRRREARLDGNSPFLFVAAAPGSDHVLAGGEDGMLRAIGLPGLELRATAPGPDDPPIRALALSPDGLFVAHGGDSPTVTIRDARTLERLYSITVPTKMVMSLAFSSDSKSLAIGGGAPDIYLWDLHRLHDKLTGLGLAWDRPAPAAPPAESEGARAAVPIIRPVNTDQAAYDAALALVRSGVVASEGGRMAEAIAGLQQARDRLRVLSRAAPGDGQVASSLAVSLGSLAGALRAENRLGEALTSLREARQVLEEILHPSSMDLYNLACACSVLSTLSAPGSPPPTAAERQALGDRAVEALRRSLAAGLTDLSPIDSDRDLDAIRDRADFRDLMLDRGFPANPFAGTPLTAAAPPRRAVAAPPGAPPAPAGYVGIGITTHPSPDGLLVTDVARGGPAARDGRLRPGDTILGVEQEVSFAGKSQGEASPYLRGEDGTTARVIVRPSGTDRREVYELPRAFIPAAPSPAATLDEAIAAAPEDPAPRFERGDLRARRGDWKAALDDISAGLERDPSPTARWMDAAALHLQLGDRDGYRRRAREMLDRFGATADPMAAERTAKVGLLADPPADDRARLVALSDLALNEGAGGPILQWFHLARGMAAYREGQHRAAAGWLRKARDSDAAGPACRAAALLYLAMSESRLGDLVAARASLDLARRTLAASEPRGGDLGPSWHDWLICRIALREAESVVLHDPAFPADPFARDGQAGADRTSRSGR